MNKRAGRAPKELSERHQRFVDEYLKDQNATRAYIRAGYTATGHSAEVNAERLLRKAEIREAVDRQTAALRAKVQAKTGVTLERTVREIARIAFMDARRMFSADGRPLHITELDDDTAAAIAGLDVLEEFQGGGESRELVGYIKRWKLADKKGALDMLMKHLGGYEADNAQQTNPLRELISAMGRSALPVVKRPDGR